jgi:catechol 2,3-dioxygenase-like lactoylglutathione lyase family enzyme
VTLRAAVPVAFVATTDAPRAKAFYADTLGLAFVAEEPFALVFDLAGTTLRIAKVEHLEPQPHTILGWVVGDLDAALDELASRGVETRRYPEMEQDSRGVWSSPSGARIAWLRDPDGNTLSLAELPR